MPGTFIDDYHPPAGAVFDRFGGPWGGWLSPDGAPFEQRSLPPSSAEMEYHRYQVVDPSSLPLGYRLEFSEIAPWIGQPGGAGQLRIITPPGRRRINVQDLIDFGFLEEVP